MSGKEITTTSEDTSIEQIAIDAISDKQEVVEEVVEEKAEENQMLKFPWSEEEKVDFKFADLHVWCRNCNTDNAPNHPMLMNVQTMMPMQLRTTSQDTMALSCANCGSQLALHFRDAKNPPVEDENISTPETEATNE